MGCLPIAKRINCEFSVECSIWWMLVLQLDLRPLPGLATTASFLWQAWATALRPPWQTACLPAPLQLVRAPPLEAPALQPRQPSDWASDGRPSCVTSRGREAHWRPPCSARSQPALGPTRTSERSTDSPGITRGNCLPLKWIAMSKFSASAW